MSRTKTGQLISAASVLMLISLALHLPAQTQAHPALGLTPTPTLTLTLTPTATPTLPPPTEPEPPTEPSPPDDEDTPPDNRVEVATSCSCTTEAEPLAVSAPIQLIHQGSGWIAEANLSNTESAHLPVPYPGTWDVFMTAPPQVNHPSEITMPTSYPVYLGSIQANSGLQSLSCPITCQEPPIPDLLPQTGNKQRGSNSLSSILILSGLVLLLTIINGLVKFIDRPTINIKIKN